MKPAIATAFDLNVEIVVIHSGVGSW